MARAPGKTGKAEAFRRALDALTAPTAMLDGPDRRILYANPAFQALCGADVVGMCLAEAMPTGEGDPAWAEALAGTAATGKALRIPALALDGHERRRYWDVDLVPQAGGSLLLQAHEVTHHVAARLAAEEQVRDCARKQNALDAVMRFVPEGITLASAPDVMIQRVSDFGVNLLAQDRTKLEGIPAEAHPEAWQVFWADGVTPARTEDLPLTRATLHGEVVINEEWVLRTATGRRILILCNAGPIRDGDGRITGGIIAWRDITAIKETEARAREAAITNLHLREIHHRLRNGLQLISAILILQAAGLTQEECRSAIQAAERRVRAIAEAYGQVTRPEDVAAMDVGAVLARMVDTLRFQSQRPDVRLNLQADELVLDLDQTVPLVLLVNELVSNALSHAFPEDGGGAVQVTLNTGGEEALLSVADDGRGFQSPTPAQGTGLLLVDTLIRQIGGRMSLDTGESGTRVAVAFRPDRNQDGVRLASRQTRGWTGP